MEILRFLEGIRNPVLDAFFSAITHLGEETFFIVFGLIFFWCINKKEGYYLLSVGFIGTVLNQFLKLWFRIPRPWVKDESFTIVEAARGGATGYSFPSGHTQSSVGVFGAIAKWEKHKILRTVCIILCVLIPLSRLYLGVHTPLDVGVSLLIALVLIFALYPFIRKCFDDTKKMRIFLIGMIILSGLYLAFVLLYNFPKDTDTDNLSHGIKNAYTMLGCTLGIYISFEIDRKYINFDTDGNFLCQCLKLILVIIPLLGIKEGLKYPLSLIFGGSYASDCIRYLLLVIFAGCIWPLTFNWFKKIGVKNCN